MPQENSSLKQRDRIDFNTPKKFNVIFHNDDFTPMDFVTAILVYIFYKSDVEAEHLMLKVHNEGKAIVGTYSYDIAVSKTQNALTVARENNFPLRITVQPQ